MGQRGLELTKCSGFQFGVVIEDGKSQLVGDIRGKNVVFGSPTRVRLLCTYSWDI